MVGGGEADKVDNAPSQSELNRGILLKLGVPAGAIETFGTANTNTRDEPARPGGFSPAGPVGARVAANSTTIVLADASFLLHSQGAIRRNAIILTKIPREHGIGETHNFAHVKSARGVAYGSHHRAIEVLSSSPVAS